MLVHQRYIFLLLQCICRAQLSADLTPCEVPLPDEPSPVPTGSSALDEAMAKTLASIDPTLHTNIPIPEESKYTILVMLVSDINDYIFRTSHIFSHGNQSPDAKIYTSS